METGLQLLMRDGAVKVAFHPRLSVEQYAELLKSVEHSQTRDELHQEVQSLAEQWGSEVQFERVGV